MKDRTKNAQAERKFPSSDSHFFLKQKKCESLEKNPGLSRAFFILLVISSVAFLSTAGQSGLVHLRPVRLFPVSGGILDVWPPEVGLWAEYVPGKAECHEKRMQGDRKAFRKAECGI